MAETKTIVAVAYRKTYRGATKWRPVTGKMTRCMGQVRILTTTGRSTRVSGKMICTTGWVRRHGRTVLSTKVNTSKGKSMGMGDSFGRMVALMRAVSFRTEWKGQVHTHGPMDESMKVTGWTT